MRFNCWGSNLINIQGHSQKLECYFPIRAMYQMEGKRLNIDDFLHWLVIFFRKAVTVSQPVSMYKKHSPTRYCFFKTNLR